MKFRAMRRRTIQTGYQKTTQLLIWRASQSGPTESEAPDPAPEPVDGLELLQRVRHTLAEYRTAHEDSAPPPSRRAMPSAQRTQRKPMSHQEQVAPRSPQPAPMSQRSQESTPVEPVEPQPGPSPESAPPTERSVIRRTSLIEEETPYSREQGQTAQRAIPEPNLTPEPSVPKAHRPAIPSLQREPNPEPDMVSPSEIEDSKAVRPAESETSNPSSSRPTPPEPVESSFSSIHALTQPLTPPVEQSQPDPARPAAPPAKVVETITARSAEPIQRSKMSEETEETPIETSSIVAPQPLPHNEPAAPPRSDSAVVPPTPPQAARVTNQLEEGEADTPAGSPSREVPQPERPAETIPVTDAPVTEVPAKAPAPVEYPQISRPAIVESSDEGGARPTQDVVQPARETTPLSPSTVTDVAKEMPDTVLPAAGTTELPPKDAVEARRDSGPEAALEISQSEIGAALPPPDTPSAAEAPAEVANAIDQDQSVSDPPSPGPSIEPTRQPEKTEPTVPLADEAASANTGQFQPSSNVQAARHEPLSLSEDLPEATAKVNPFSSVPDEPGLSIQESEDLSDLPTGPTGGEPSLFHSTILLSSESTGREDEANHPNVAPVIQREASPSLARSPEPPAAPQQPPVTPEQVGPPEGETVSRQVNPLSALEGWVVQHTSAVQRDTPAEPPAAPSAGDTATSSETEAASETETPAFDVEQMSRQVYQILRRRLRVEQERLQGRRG